MLLCEHYELIQPNCYSRQILSSISIFIHPPEEQSSLNKYDFNQDRVWILGLFLDFFSP